MTYDLKLTYTLTSLPFFAATKMTSDNLGLYLDYSRWLAAGETLVSVASTVITASNPPLILNPAKIIASYEHIMGSMAEVSVTGGQSGVTYGMGFTVNTTNGRNRTDTINIGVTAPLNAGPAGGYPISDISENAALPNVWIGVGMPWTGLGATGDYYLDTVTKALYGPQNGGTWPADPTYTLPSWYTPNTVI